MGSRSPRHELPHAGVAHQQVGGGGVFVDEQRPCPCLEGLGKGRGLGGAAAGVVGVEGSRAAAAGQVRQPRADVDPPYAAAILGPHLHCVLHGDDPLAPVARHVVEVALLDGLQEGGLAMVAAADDQRDAAADAETPHGSVVGLQGGGKGRGGLQGDGVGKRGGVDAGPTGKHAAVGQEGDEAGVGELVAELVLDADAVHVVGDLAWLAVDAFGGVREVLGEQRPCLASQDAAAPGRQSHRHADLGDPVRVQAQGAALGDLGTWPVDLQDSGRPGPPLAPPEVLAEAPQQGVFEGGARRAVVGSTVLGRHKEADAGGGGEGVALHVVDAQLDAVGQLPGPLQITVGGVGAAVDAVEGPAEVVGGAHAAR